jgi:heptose I phosphotransferase
MWLDERYRPTLGERGLTQFDRVMRVFGGRCEKALPDREVWHFRLKTDGPSPRGIYVKRHHWRTWSSRLRALLRLPPAPTPGRIEAANVRRLASQGIAVMRLLAYGEKVRADGLQESFVITEELEEFAELHHYLRRKYSGPPTEHSEKTLLQLIRDIARIARRFHAAGYNHRDLYCCHFFVKELPSERCEIRLIDLQRVQRRRWLRRRWIVKDLAQLSWSAPTVCIQCRHKIAFLHEYFGVKKLRAAHKRLIAAIIHKQRKMERKLGNDN